ncbi:MAG: enoyl-CoA hydratase [Alphaproteobacteria bacterium]|nr:enoyl-CoA hydratase [Alphaproteobacteria bacterium]
MELNTEKMLAEKENGIGWMTFNQPERRNAISHEMREAILTILDDFEADPAVRVIVMTGAGDKAFVSGSDISRGEKGEATPEQLERQGQLSNLVRDRYLSLNKPLIAMIRGYCLGGGVATALYADLRIAAEDAQFGIPAARLGNAYNWSYTRMLVDIVGAARAKEILITARRYSAAESLQMGLVHQVVAPNALEQTVRDIAAAIVDNAPLSVIAAKAMIDEIVKDPDARDMNRVRAVRKACIESADFAEGRRAFNEKRKPVWTGT